MSSLRFISLGLIGFITLQSAYATEVRAAKTLTRGTILTEQHIALSSDEQTDLLDAFIGKELKRTVYANAKLTPSMVGKPLLVKRNAKVRMTYRLGALEITAWGRALGQGGEGETISLLNTDSRKRVEGLILKDGSVEVY